MKNVTVSLDESLYRETRIFAAEANTTVTAMVRDFLISLHGERAKQIEKTPSMLISEALSAVRSKHPNFDQETPLSREELYDHS